MASSGLDTQATCGAGALTAGAQSTESLDKQRVDGERLRLVHQGVEHLVVAGGGHVEQLADGLLLGPRVLPPLALEREDLPLTAVQLASGGRAVRTRTSC